MSTDLTGTVRLSPNGRSLAVLWPSPPHADRWIVTDQWGSTGYETDARVADWPIVGAVPYSPAAGMALDGTGIPTATANSVTEYGVRVPIDDDTNQIIGVSVDRDTTEGALRDHRSVYPASGQALVQRTATRGPWTNIEAGAR